MPFSEDLRKRTVQDIIINGPGAVENICRVYGVSRRSAFRWEKKHRLTGNVRAKKRASLAQQMRTSIPPHHFYWVEEYLDAQPHATMEELAEEVRSRTGVRYHVRTILRDCNERMQLTRKVIFLLLFYHLFNLQLFVRCLHFSHWSKANHCDCSIVRKSENFLANNSFSWMKANARAKTFVESTPWRAWPTRVCVCLQ
jgi:transposase